MASDKEPNYTFYGDQLEELNEDDLWARKPIPVEEQIVTDKQGRRRFHGAFTGGFSAGYFNTVGSEEGWKPSTFQSSRAEKASKVLQRPEDFMDDEDQEVFGIAPKVLRAKQEYKKASSRPATSTGLLDSLLKPVRDTVGVVLLKRMGWRPGQGIGPRQTAREKKERRKIIKKSQRVYGCMGPEPPEKDESESSGGSDNENILFAPDDLPSFPVAPKTNTFGMGYVGLDKNSQLLSTGRFTLFEPPEAVMNAKKSGIGMRGQAFGVGAFEKEDDDIYTTDDINRYDFFLESTSESKKRRLQEKKNEMEKKKKQDKARCLENFMPATQPMSTVTFYPAPIIPQHFVPKHGVRQSRFSEPRPELTKQSQPKGRHDLTAKERAILVGEVGEKVTIREQAASSKPMPVLDFEVVPTELKSGQFNPFSQSSEKLERYKKYLTLRKLKQAEKIVCLQPKVMTEWEKARERNEFEQAAVLYQPLAEMISDRFVSAATLVGSDEIPLEPAKKPVEESVQAAKQKLFGKMTRTTDTWHPCALLCKRFNVPEPHSGLAPTNTKKKPNFSVFDFLAAQAPKVDNNKSLEILIKPAEPEKARLPTPPIDGTTLETKQPQPAVEAVPVLEPSSSKELPLQKPPDVFTTEKMTTEDKMDLFKSVFLSSSEDENDDDEEPTKELSPPPPPRRPRSPPKGVFKTLDLIAPRKTPVPEPAAAAKPSVKVPEPNPNLYGPSLPPTASSSKALPDIISITPITPAIQKLGTVGGVWVEKSGEKRHKKKQKRSKSRSKSRERSHKKRKHDKKYDSDESDYKKDKKKKHKKHKH